MSSTVKARDFEKAAQKKGFCLDRCHDHIFFRLIKPDGTFDDRIQTKISHGAVDISASNLSKMKRQLKFTSMEQFQNYISCTLTLDEYYVLLKKQGF
ncbi:MAG TPA: hypothetical protein O0X70_01090 [Methanocorpusculum sp.]|nr:hypothetical protein [Methanocorpusculum sp.]